MKINKDQLLLILGGLVLFMAGYIVGQKTAPSAPQTMATAPGARPMDRGSVPRLKPDYFVSKSLEAEQSGIAMMLAPEVNGAVIIERCFPPDYVAGIPTGRPERKPCQMLVRGNIETIDGDKIVIRNKLDQKSVELTREEKGESTFFSIAGLGQWEMVKGQKNLMIQMFDQLPSVAEGKTQFMKALASKREEQIKVKLKK